MTQHPQIRLSNALADLAERVKASVGRQAQAEHTAAQEALAAGAMLIEAKALTSHGEWLPFLNRARLHERQARRLMQLARSGIKSDTVSDLGGVKATLEWLKGRVLPAPGHVLLMETGDDHERDPLAALWPVDGGERFHLGIVDLKPEWPEVVSTRRPMGGDPVYLWRFIDSALGDRLRDVRYSTVPADDPRAAFVIEAVAEFPPLMAA